MSTNRIFLTTLGLTGLFLATGGVELGASIAFKNTMDGTGPADGDDAIRRLLYERFPLLAGTVNGAFVMATAVFVGLGLLMPTRGLLKAGGYMVTVCALFTLCVGVFLWIMTLQVKAAFSSVYLAQEPEVQSLIQQSVSTAGWTHGERWLTRGSSNAVATLTRVRLRLLPIRRVRVQLPRRFCAAVARPSLASPISLLTTSSLHCLAWSVSLQLTSHCDYCVLMGHRCRCGSHLVDCMSAQGSEGEGQVSAY